MPTASSTIAQAELHRESEYPWWRRMRVARRLLDLQRRNVLSRTPVADGTGPVVSLTSHGARIATVHFAIESIAAGSVRPTRLILWLDEPGVVRKPPQPLRRLQRRGLEIRHANNFGPHTKYYPYVSQEAVDRPLVIADDDILYPRNWLAGLKQAYSRLPNSVHAYRAHVARLDDGPLRFLPYSQWSECTSTRASYRNFATGCSGALFPPGILAALKDSKTAFLEVCPRADDIWLNLHCLRARHPVSQVHTESLRFPVVLMTQGQGLFHHNIFAGGNDKALADTFRAQDLQDLLALP